MYLPTGKRLLILLMVLNPVLWVAAPCVAQVIASSEAQVASVRAIHVISGHDGPAVEILSNHPLVPVISNLANPQRLVIDLPNANLSLGKKVAEFHSDEVATVRVNQYQKTPPVTRVVLDLVKPVDYTWDAAGNRLMVRVHAADTMKAKLPSVPSTTSGVQPVFVPVSSPPQGGVSLAGSQLAEGSSITAGSDTAVLRLGRGGEVRVCPGTTVSVTSSRSSKALMLGMSVGALEAHYHLDSSSDSIVTPDFRIQLPGPGDFHFAVSSDSRGNTCVRALPGNTASVIVSELLGDGVYQVKPSDRLVFHAGKLTLVDAVIPSTCGCEPPPLPVMRASVPDVPQRSSGSDQTSSLRAVAQISNSSFSETDGIKRGVAAPPGGLSPETAALPSTKPGEVHVEVEAPFVFRAQDMPEKQLPPVPPAPPLRQASLLRVTRIPEVATLTPLVLPPPPSDGKVSHGFFGKLRNFFATIFG